MFLFARCFSSRSVHRSSRLSSVARAQVWFECLITYAEQHDTYSHNCHTSTVWFRQVFQEQSPAAALRRQKALPLIAQDLMRVPDHIFSGPEMPLDDSVRARFFGEC